MRPEYYIFRFGHIIAGVWSETRLEKNKAYRFMVFCHGLPSHPYQHNPAKIENLIKGGFVLVFPNYIGTWASYGKMSWENCVNTVLETIGFLKRGGGTEIRNNLEVMWGVKEIIIVGNSFGGSVALVAGAKSSYVKKIISFSAPTDYKNHSKIEGEEAEPIDKLYDSVIQGWRNLWRIPSKGEWERLARGNVDINPVDYIEKLKDKDVFLIHGSEDNIVSPLRSEELYKKLESGKGNHVLTILKGEKHIGYDYLGNKYLASKILRWLG